MAALIAVFLILLSYESTAGLPSTSCDAVCTYEAKTDSADCSNSSLSYIPESCSSAVSLNVQGNDLGFLPSGTFANFTFLKGLDVSKSGVAKLEVGAFSGPLSLRKLYLNGNNVTELQDGIFDDLTDLKVLNLAGNSIMSVGEGKFQSLVSLIKLIAADNLIMTLDAEAFVGLKSLTTLTLSRNSIKEIHADTFSYLPNLEYLYLGVNKLTALPHGTFGDLQMLKLLSLPGNQLTVIPPSILNLNSIRKLDIQDNLIQDVSPIVPVLVQLSDLYLNGNPLQCSGCPELLADWVAMRYPDNQMECSMPDGTSVRVVSMSSVQSIEDNAAVTSRSGRSFKPDYPDYTSPDDTDSEWITMLLYILVPITAVIFVSSIVFLEYLTRQKIARKNAALGDSEALGEIYHDQDESNVRSFANDVVTSHGRALKTLESPC